jgi:hypothetical protein
MKWPDDHSVRYGNDPTSTEFGGKRFYVDHESIGDAHSNYWEQGSASLMNLAFIATGRYDKVQIVLPPRYPPPTPQPETPPRVPVQKPAPASKRPTPTPTPGEF